MALSYPVEILHVDDEPECVDLVETYLEEENQLFNVRTALRPEEGLKILAESNIGCIVSDYDMPEMDGIEFLDAVRETYPDLPFILYTGKGSEQVAADAIAAGATDYLQKGTGTDQYTVLANRISNAVEQRRTRLAKQETERRLSRLTDHSPDVFWMFTADWEELLFVNNVYKEIYGQSQAALRSGGHKALEAVHPEDRDRVKDAMSRLSNGEQIHWSLAKRRIT